MLLSWLVNIHYDHYSNSKSLHIRNLIKYFHLVLFGETRHTHFEEQWCVLFDSFVMLN